MVCTLGVFHSERYRSRTIRVTVQYCKTLQRGGGGGYQVVPDSVELHDVPWLTLQPELVKLYEEVAEKANQLFLNCTRYMNL